MVYTHYEKRASLGMSSHKVEVHRAQLFWFSLCSLMDASWKHFSNNSPSALLLESDMPWSSLAGSHCSGPKDLDFMRPRNQACSFFIACIDIKSLKKIQRYQLISCKQANRTKYLLIWYFIVHFAEIKAKFAG